METKTITKLATSSQGARLFAHQLITSDDLVLFKQELLAEFENLFKSYSILRKKKFEDLTSVIIVTAVI